MILSQVVGETYFEQLKGLLGVAKNDRELFEAIVNAPFHDRRCTTTLGLGFLSFVLVNKKSQTIDRIAISKTDTARGAIAITVKPFRELTVPLGYKGNAVAEAIRSGRYQQTSDWSYLLIPVLEPEEAR